MITFNYSRRRFANFMNHLLRRPLGPLLLPKVSASSLLSMFLDFNHLLSAVRCACLIRSLNAAMCYRRDSWRHRWIILPLLKLVINSLLLFIFSVQHTHYHTFVLVISFDDFLYLERILESIHHLFCLRAHLWAFIFFRFWLFSFSLFFHLFLCFLLHLCGLNVFSELVHSHWMVWTFEVKILFFCLFLWVSEKILSFEFFIIQLEVWSAGYLPKSIVQILKDDELT